MRYDSDRAVYCKDTSVHAVGSWEEYSVGRGLKLILS